MSASDGGGAHQSAKNPDFREICPARVPKGVSISGGWGEGAISTRSSSTRVPDRVPSIVDSVLYHSLPGLTSCKRFLVRRAVIARNGQTRAAVSDKPEVHVFGHFYGIPTNLELASVSSFGDGCIGVDARCGECIRFESSHHSLQTKPVRASQPLT